MSFFHFTSRERIGIITLITISVILGFYFETFTPDIQQNIPQISTKEFKKYNHQSNHHIFVPKEKKQFHFVSFDPNTLPLDGFISMGLTEKQAQVIIRYRDKGGRFRTAEDFSKIYSISPDIHRAIKPYISIDTSLFPVRKHFQFKKHTNSIELNQANEEELTKLPLIDCSRAHTIITYREKLGGFYSMQQLYEVYGLTPSIVDSIKPFIRIDTSIYKRININSASFEEIKRHPYFKYFTAKKITDYKNIRGSIVSISELLRYKILDTLTYRKILPYISVK